MKLKVDIRELEYADCKAAFEAISLVEVRKISGYSGLHESHIASSAIDQLKRLPPALRDELMLIGAITASKEYIDECKTQQRRQWEGTAEGRAWEAAQKAKDEKRSRLSRALHEARREKVKAFDRIVELLDHHKVNGKALGDCRRGDLLRAATENLSRADDLTVHAALYKQLAGMIGDGTVREYRDRAGVVALLTTTFEAA